MTHPRRAERIPCVYIMASRPGGALYVGVTSVRGEIPAYAGMTVRGRGRALGGGIPAYAGMTVMGMGMTVS